MGRGRGRRGLLRRPAASGRQGGARDGRCLGEGARGMPRHVHALLAASRLPRRARLPHLASHHARRAPGLDPPARQLRDDVLRRARSQVRPGDLLLGGPQSHPGLPGGSEKDGVASLEGDTARVHPRRSDQAHAGGCGASARSGGRSGPIHRRHQRDDRSHERGAVRIPAHGTGADRCRAGRAAGDSPQDAPGGRAVEGFGGARRR